MFLDKENLDCSKIIPNNASEPQNPIKVILINYFLIHLI